MTEPTATPLSFTEALQRGRAALDLLASLLISPTPMRFWVSYLHESGEVKDLSLSVNRLLAHRRLTGQALDELYLQFVAPETDPAGLNYASQKALNMVVDVTGQINQAWHKHEHYGQQLQSFSGALESGDSLRQQESVAQLLAATTEMIRDQTELEDRLGASLREMQALRRDLDRLEREARKDPLTGIGNRAFFDRELKTAIAQRRKEPLPLCLLMIDIDHFKRFNDHYGHQMGDQVLKLVARQLTQIAGDDYAPARYGGEEFVLILPRTAITDAVNIADQIRQLVASKTVTNRRTGEALGRVTLSIGVASHHVGESGAEFLHRADEAMYRAKAAGRDRVVAEDEAATK